ncbi:hypothetical protein B0T22DRAFT_464423 [Podospora appendiculata]|uniref:Uncharacterized protein n=1 Tax=Podospora appendiculata TaxID=314037 RepID=A0AAE0X4M1_9PEZI|nr:hypothetical protein B0T22DRAFT_464423 [Podospora appendiculata]
MLAPIRASRKITALLAMPCQLLQPIQWEGARPSSSDNVSVGEGREGAEPRCWPKTFQCVADWELKLEARRELSVDLVT